MRRTRHEEAERVAFYDEHVHDPDLWSEPVEPPPGERREGLGAAITVRFTAAEAGDIRRLARERKQTYSQIVREAVRAYTRPHSSVTVTAPTGEAAHGTNRMPQDASGLAAQGSFMADGSY